MSNIYISNKVPCYIYITYIKYFCNIYLIKSHTIYIYIIYITQFYNSAYGKFYFERNLGITSFST